jgi:hypothetical protein
MTEEIITTSNEITDRVRINVPYGSPNFIARASEWRTTEKMHAIIIVSSPALNTKPDIEFS